MPTKQGRTARDAGRRAPDVFLLQVRHMGRNVEELVGIENVIVAIRIGSNIEIASRGSEK